ncbi:MAG: polar amino acid transport system substrate-binding protein [bacterium]|jgi:polar amino acid transport system substrate-binding protein
MSTFFSKKKWLALSIATLYFLISCSLIYAKSFNIVTGEYPPYSGKDLKHGGIITEIISSVFKEMGQEVKIHYMDWPKVYQKAANASYFATFPWLKDKQREVIFKFSAPLITITERFFVTTDSKITYIQKNDLMGLSACVPKTYSLKPLQSFLKRRLITVRTPKNTETCFHLLKNKKVSMVALSEQVGWLTIKNIYGNHSGFRTLKKVLNQTKLHLIISKLLPNTDKFLEKFNKTFKKLEKKGIIAQIIKRHIH